jgi:DNA-binding CsgD family transcriptional regulator
MAMKFSALFPAIGFTAFVYWLLSTVMDGPLPAAIGIPNASSFFLPAHIPSLLLIGFFCPRPLFDRLAPANCVLSAALTLALAWANPSAGRYILILLGASGAFMTIDACVALRRSAAPLLGAACGLVIANLLFMPLSAGAEGSWWQFAAVAAPLLAIPILKQWLSESDPARNGTGLWHYLPFIVVFQIVSGLMYAFLMPAYNQSALLPGFELLFYIAAVFLAFRIAQKNRDLTLVFGVVSGMAAFALLYNGPSALRINLSMFAMQAGAGFIDLSIIAVLLAFPKPVRAFGIGTATLCSGIVGGKIIGHYFADFSEAIVLTGNLVLNLSILTLYFLGRYHYIGRPAAEASAAATDPPQKTIDSNPEPDDDNLPAHLRLLLSEREYIVLKRALAGSTYRETARELEISESTVKTYMYRIYEKMGVKRKKELFELLRNP